MKAEELKALLRTRANNDDEAFWSVALRLAAKEARLGHHKLAKELKAIVDDATKVQSSRRLNPPTRLERPHSKDLADLLSISHPTIRRSDLVLDEEVKSRLDSVLLEQRQKEKLRQFGLSPRRKLLFLGPPGTGKTLSASMLAAELKLPLYTIVFENLITRYMGETGAKLRLVFEHIAATRAVYLFDEFDAIGGQRTANNDVGEIRRVLNSFLLSVEKDSSESVIVAATNHPELLDRALYRRFDDIVEFSNPTLESIKRLLESKLARFEVSSADIAAAARECAGLSASDVARAAEDAAKVAVLAGSPQIRLADLATSIKNRRLGVGSGREGQAAP